MSTTPADRLQGARRSRHSGSLTASRIPSATTADICPYCGQNVARLYDGAIRTHSFDGQQCDASDRIL